MIKTINTLEPRLPLSDQALIESAGLPYPLPNGTSISCKVIAAGVNVINLPRTIERETPIVTVVVDPGSGGDPDAMFDDTSLAVSLDWITENGTATVDIDNGVYDVIEWEVTETAQPPEGGRVLVQQVEIERVAGGNVATTSLAVEEVFQFAQGGNADIMFSPTSGDVTICWFWHGNHADGDDINGNPWGATTTPTTDRVSFPSDGRRLEYYDTYEILFIYTSADGTTVNGSVGDEYSFKLSPEGDQVYGVPVGEISNVGQPSYLKIPTSRSSQVGSPDGIPSWGTDGDKIEYFIYRLDPA